VAELSPTPSGPEGGGRHGRGALVAAGALLVALGVFIGQNTEETTVTWLFVDATQPLWVVLAVTAVLALALGELGGWALRRRRRPD